MLYINVSVGALCSSLMCPGCTVLNTAGWTAAVDGRHPQVRRASVKDDLKGLRRSSNRDDSIVSQLKVKTGLTHHIF